MITETRKITELEVEEILRRGFGDYLEPLAEISKDSANEKFLLDRPDTFYNYDKIVGALFEDAGGYRPKSPDMILFKKNTIVFVEFKNGKINAGEKNKIKLKAVEGGIISLHRIVSKDKNDLNFIDTMRLKKSYVLVYNTGKNPSNEIHDRVESRAARFGLHIYQETLFHKVKAVSPDIFSNWLDRVEEM